MNRDSKEYKDKVEEAIKLGFIIRSTDRDGVVRFELTDWGLNQWFYEINNGWRPK